MGHCLFMRKGETHTAPISGILASDLAVGSSVYLMEDGAAVEYLVVNQGKPSGSSLYDDSCDGTWLLRKDIKEDRKWNNQDVNDYANSTIHAWLNVDFFNSLGSVEKSAIKQVKIPYRKGSGAGTTITSGESGLSTKCFLLSAAEMNWSQTTSSYIPNDGASLSYFYGCSTIDSKRIAKLNGIDGFWYLRTPFCHPSSPLVGALFVLKTGGWSANNCYSGSALGIRPAVILPPNALFDTNTLILKGVA